MLKLKSSWPTKLASVLCLLLTTSIFASDTLSDIAKRGELRVGLEAGYIPFEMKNKKGEIIGFEVDLANLMAREMGVKLKLVNTEWDGIIPALMTEKFDLILSGMSLTQERNMKILFSDPYMVIGQTVLIPTKNQGKIKSYKDLNNPKYNVASKMGTTGETAVKRLISKSTYRAYQTEQEAVMEVTNGKVDAYIYDAPYNIIYAQTKGKGKVIHLDKPFTYEPMAMGIRKGDHDLLNWVNNFLRQIKNDGRFQDMEERWFKKTDWLSDIQ